MPRIHASLRTMKSLTKVSPKAAAAPNIVSPSDAPMPVTMPAMMLFEMVRRTQRMAAGPTGTAIRKPMTAPSMKSSSGSRP